MAHLVGPPWKVTSLQPGHTKAIKMILVAFSTSIQYYEKITRGCSGETLKTRSCVSVFYTEQVKEPDGSVAKELGIVSVFLCIRFYASPLM